MIVTLKEFTDEIDALVEFLMSDTWNFYGTPNPKEENIRRAHGNHYYVDEGIKTFWIDTDLHGTVGMIRLYDLEDGTPLFDIRIHSSYQGLGIGTVAIQQMLQHVFEQYEAIDRVEANTRQDNYGMRCVFSKCGFVKEAHFRNGWKCSNGDAYDAVGYGITKSDWIRQEKTYVNWNDYKC